MGQNEVPIHYLRGNEGEWTPPAVVYFDTETEPETVNGREVQRLVCWCARLVRRRNKHKTLPDTEDASGQTADELASQIVAWSKSEPTLWVYVHNLSFDLAVTRLPDRLFRQGWSCSDANLWGKTLWLRLNDGRHHLTITDSWGWLPESMETLSHMVNRQKVTLPTPGDGLAAWQSRCWGDVDILSESIGQLMDWWQANKLGRWSITGASCGWNAYRHNPATGQVLIDPDPEARAFERQAVRGGRRDVWRVGDAGPGPFSELDFSNAYPAIAATCPLPVRRGVRMPFLPLNDPLWHQDRWGAICECVIRTERPVYPCRHEGETWYPVGEFATVLAWPELREAREHGELVSCGPGYKYLLGNAMQGWAKWILNLLHNPPEGTPKVALVAAKSWSRSVIGKWATRSGRKVDQGPAQSPTWQVSEGIDHATGCKAAMVDMGDKRWWIVKDQEGDNTFPAILAWIESEVRVRLGRATDELGDQVCISCDTDGILIDDKRLAPRWVGDTTSDGRQHPIRATVDNVGELLYPLTYPLLLRPKRTLEGVYVLGAQQRWLDGQREWAGIPRKGIDQGSGAVEYDTWPGLAWQIRQGEPDGYVIRHTRATLGGPHARRWITAADRALPVRMMVDPAGQNHLMHWRTTIGGDRTVALAGQAHPVLARLEGQYPCQPDQRPLRLPAIPADCRTRQERNHQHAV